MSACRLTIRVDRDPVYIEKIHRSILIYSLLFNAWYVGLMTLAIFSGRTDASWVMLASMKINGLPTRLIFNGQCFVPLGTKI